MWKGATLGLCDVNISCGGWWCGACVLDGVFRVEMRVRCGGSIACVCVCGKCEVQHASAKVCGHVARG